MSYRVPIALKSISLNETDTVKSVLQNVSIILRTKLGTVPLYRDFGVSSEYLDKPIMVATPMLYAEIKEAIEAFEPRASVVNISFESSVTEPGKLIPTVEVNITDE